MQLECFFVIFNSLYIYIYIVSVRYQRCVIFCFIDLTFSISQNYSGLYASMLNDFVLLFCCILLYLRSHFWTVYLTLSCVVLTVQIFLLTGMLLHCDLMIIVISV